MAARILRRRRELGYTQKELGRRCGVTRQTVSAWEHGIALDIQGKHLELLGRALKMPTKWILEGGAIESADEGKAHATPAQKLLLDQVMRMTEKEVQRTMEFVQRLEQEQRELYEQLRARFENQNTTH